MGLPYVCPKMKAKVEMAFNGWNVFLGGKALAKFDRISPAKTFAKRLNSALRWLGPCTEAFVGDFGDAINAFLVKAGSGDGSYVPPLNLFS